MLDTNMLWKSLLGAGAGALLGSLRNKPGCPARYAAAGALFAGGAEFMYRGYTASKAEAQVAAPPAQKKIDAVSTSGLALTGAMLGSTVGQPLVGALVGGAVGAFTGFNE